MKYLCGEAYRLMCDTTFHPGMKLETDGTVFVKTDFAPEFLDKGHNGKKCVMVTHESDYEVTPDMVAAAPANVVHWFGVNMAEQTERSTAIPLGIGSPWLSHGDEKAMDNARESADPLRNVGLAAFAIDTNTSERGAWLSVLNRRPWVTNKAYFFHQKRPMTFQEYLLEVRRHAAIFAPSGNGRDTHRIWEALYLQRVPFVSNAPHLKHFAGLPIAYVENLDTLLLDTVMQGVIGAYSKEVDWRPLTPEYWAEKFKAALKGGE